MNFAILIPIVLFSIIALIVKWSLDHSKWKIQHRSGGASTDNSLRTSELRALIREAVEEANAPLTERVEALEARLDTPARHTPLLDAPLEAYEAETTPVAQKQRVS